MKPSGIFNVLDAALAATANGDKFVPLFTGEAGIGKSEIAQAWAKKQRERNPEFGFIDLRLAYLESPDFVGLVFFEKKDDGTTRTHYALPEFWPTKGEGLILIEEPNRGNASVMNCLMQLLTDRAVQGYRLPAGWVLAGAINPENGQYDVNTMDAALRNRFTEFEVVYDKREFVEFMREQKWDNVLIAWTEELFAYKTTKELAPNEVYIAPRSLSKLNAIHRVAGANALLKSVEAETAKAVLGSLSASYLKFRDDERPLLADDFIKDFEAAKKHLAQINTTDTYRGDMMSVLISSLKEAVESDKLSAAKLVSEVLNELPVEAGAVLMEGIVDHLDYSSVSDKVEAMYETNEACKIFKERFKAFNSEKPKKTHAKKTK